MKGEERRRRVFLGRQKIAAREAADVIRARGRVRGVVMRQRVVSASSVVEIEWPERERKMRSAWR